MAVVSDDYIEETTKPIVIPVAATLGSVELYNFYGERLGGVRVHPPINVKEGDLVYVSVGLREAQSEGTGMPDVSSDGEG